MKTNAVALPSLKPTLNNMGYMFEDLTAYGDEFIRFSQKSGGPVLEVAAAYGVTTLKILCEGIKVTANDIDSRHLEILKAHVPSNQTHLLKLAPGRFPSDLSFKRSSFEAVLIANVFHFLKGVDIDLGMQKIYSWLKPGGKVFIIAATPYVRMFHEYIPSFEQRRERKVDWPGFVEDMSIFKTSERLDQLPPFMNFFHPHDLSRVLKKAGFEVEKAEFIPQPTWPPDMQLDGRESVGVIGRKGCELYQECRGNRRKETLTK